MFAKSGPTAREDGYEENMTAVRKTSAATATIPAPAPAPGPAPAALDQDRVAISGAHKLAGWTTLTLAKAASLEALALESPEVARQIQQANLGRPGWTQDTKVKPGGIFGWWLSLFEVRRNRPSFGTGKQLPAGTTVWVPAELDPAQPPPKGFRRVKLPAGSWSPARLTGGYRDFLEALAKGNPGLTPERLATGGLYVNLPDTLPLAAGLPAVPPSSSKAPTGALTLLTRHLAHRGDPHVVDIAHGLLQIGPGDTPSSLGKLIFNDPARWHDLALGAGVGPDTDLAGAGWTAIALPATYQTPDWGDVYPLHPVDPFLQQLAPAAAAIEEKYGIPAAVTLAQAAVESAMGSSKIGDYNVFGIKGTGSRGSIRTATTEFVKGRQIEIEDDFANYGSWQEAMDAHAQVFHQPVYAKARQHPHDPVAFAKAIAGIYATDPTYSAALISVMLEQDLLPSG